MSIDLLVKRELKPEDFKAQLFAALIDSRLRQMLPRVPVEWGQRQVLFEDLTEACELRSVAIFDRRDGGEMLCEGLFTNNPPAAVLPHDSVIVHFQTWPGQ